MNHILNRYLPFLMKSPFFCRFWTLFGQFLCTFPIQPVSMIPWLLNWIIIWIESADFFFNLIIFWIQPWVRQYWVEYWMNHFLAKIKHWINQIGYRPPLHHKKQDLLMKMFTKVGTTKNTTECFQRKQITPWPWCSFHFVSGPSPLLSIPKRRQAQGAQEQGHTWRHGKEKLAW